MASERLSRLQRRILQAVYDAEARSGWSVMPSSFEIRQEVSGNKGNISVSVRNLEGKGLLKVYRTSGGQASSIGLTPEGKNRALRLQEVLNKE